MCNCGAFIILFVSAGIYYMDLFVLKFCITLLNSISLLFSFFPLMNKVIILNHKPAQLLFEDKHPAFSNDLHMFLY